MLLLFFVLCFVQSVLCGGQKNSFKIFPQHKSLGHEACWDSCCHWLCISHSSCNGHEEKTAELKLGCFDLLLIIHDGSSMLIVHLKMELNYVTVKKQELIF